MKTLIQKEFPGGDVGLSLDGRMVVLQGRYDLGAVAIPVVEKFAEKLKAKIPGSIDDKLIDIAIKELKEELGIA